jgi:hypothetical protein
MQSDESQWKRATNRDKAVRVALEKILRRHCVSPAELSRLPEFVRRQHTLIESIENYIQAQLDELTELRKVKANIQQEIQCGLRQEFEADLSALNISVLSLKAECQKLRDECSNLERQTNSARRTYEKDCLQPLQLKKQQLEREVASLTSQFRGMSQRYRRGRLTFTVPPAGRRAVPQNAKVSWLPELPGIYFFWENFRCAYVGQSTFLKRRVIKSHHAYVSGDKVSFLLFGESDLNVAEALYIGILQPHRNGPFQVHPNRTCARCQVVPENAADFKVDCSVG